MRREAILPVPHTPSPSDSLLKSPFLLSLDELFPPASGIVY